MASGTLSRRLLHHGIEARSTRNTALLGLHVNTATRWATYARRDWSAYLAARAEDARREGEGAGKG